MRLTENGATSLKSSFSVPSSGIQPPAFVTSTNELKFSFRD